MARPHVAAIVGRAIGLPLCLALLGLWLKWPAIARFYADDTSGDVALTVYTHDVSPGGTIDAYVRVDGGERAALGTIIVRGAGDDQRIPGSAATWGGKIKGGSGEASTSRDFEIAVPETVAPGPLELEIEVHFIEAHTNPLDKTFVNGRSHQTFTYEVMVTTPVWTAAFRIGRVLLALASWGAVVWLLVWLARTFAQREIAPSPLWLVLVLPYTYVGYIWFAHQLTIATGMSSTPFSLAAIAGWLATLPVTARVLGRVGYADYRVVSAEPKPPASEQPDPYRSPAAVPARTATVRAVTDAWLAIGLLVVEKRGALAVRFMGGEGQASVAIPESRVFGDVPFVIRAQEEHLADEMLRALVPLLGPLRCRIDEQLSERTYGSAT